MARYTLKSVTAADRQYANLPEATRRLADRRIQELLENPTGNPDKQYDPQFGQWSIPIGSDKGWIVYAIVEGTVALADHGLGQGGVMRRRPVWVPAPRSGFAGFRYPREVIVLAVRWYLPAPRGASSYPRRSREELEGRFLGPMAYLDAKARGNSSLPEKQRSCSGV
jgi:hypothetical protein